MQEFFDILNPDGTRTGLQKNRTQVHQDGDLHGSVHIWLIRENQTLLQLRSLQKDSFPGCYDVASTGHVDSGETFLQSAIREVFEEIGLCISEYDLIYLFTQRLDVSMIVHGRPFVSNEINQVYLLKETTDLTCMDYQREEIDALTWISLSDLENALQSGDSRYCITYDEFRKVTKHLPGSL